MDRMQPINITTTPLTLTAEAHSGTVITANRAAGITFTLPAALGYGSIFEFVVGTTITSNNLVIQVANSTDIMQGVAVVATDNASDVVVAFEAGAADDTITMNGSTKGGIKGDRIILKDVSAGLWSVNIFAAGTGTEVTMFSSAV
jgi:hypothetical protein